MIYEFDGYELDTGRHRLRRSGEDIPLEPQVFDVLVHLVQNRSRTVTKDQLLDEVWGDRYVSESALTSRIKAVRKALDDDGRTQRRVRTVRGRGYQFVAETTERSVGSGEPPVRGAEGTIPRTRYARSGGYSIAYQVLGDGDRDLVFIPGFVSNLDLQWEVPEMASCFRRLAEGRRLIMFDKRGTGLSDRVPPNELPTLEERMDDVRAVMDHVGSERASIFGISEGGPMSLLFAASYPERVDRLAVFGSYAHGPVPDADDLAARTEKWWGSGTSFEYLAPSWANDPARRTLLARYERGSATPVGAATLVSLIGRIDVRPTLPAVPVPTLVVHRRDDAVFPIERGRELAAAIPTATFVAVDGRDHLLFTDIDPVLDVVIPFLGGADPDSPTPDRVLTTLLSARSATGEPMLPADVDRVERCLAEVGVPPAHPNRPRVTIAGGGIIASVDGPARAIRAAQLLTGSGSGSGADSDERTAVARAAVHTSEVVLVDGRPAGPGVDVAVAASALAEPGEVLVSRTVRDLIFGSGIELVYRGAHALTDDADRWELYAAVSGVRA